MNEVHFKGCFRRNAADRREGALQKRRKQNERSSFSKDVSDEMPPTEGRGHYNYKEELWTKKKNW